MVTEPRARWVVDYEFMQPPGARPRPVCVVAMRLDDGFVVRRWLHGVEEPEPLDLDGCEMVAYMASAEVSCSLALGWPLPSSVVDLYAEHRLAHNGLLLRGQFGLIAALRSYGAIDDRGLRAADRRKREMRRLIVDRGPPWGASERRRILDYCENDVTTTALLWYAMKPGIDAPRARHRGEYMVAVAEMEARGIPVDVPYFEILRDRWDDVRRWIAQLAGYWYPRVWRGTHFNVRGFEWWLRRSGITWPRHPMGRPRLDGDTMKMMAAHHPQLQRMREAVKTLGRMRQLKLSVGADGRNRTSLWAFSSRTSRNQPSNSASIFGGPKWIRSLIRPAEGRALAYVDWRQQEFGIAAALSEDAAMLAAYRDPGGDPYVAFARTVGAVPGGATAASHPVEREIYKVASLAILYGMGEWSLSGAIGLDPPYAARIIGQHRLAFPGYWKWSDSVAVTMAARGYLETVMGWRMGRGILDPSHVALAKHDRSVRNWPVQSTGADMLRVACVLARRDGVKVCMPVHDALLIEADERDVDDAIVATQAAMADASLIVLKGKLMLRTSSEHIVRWPERYRDSKGQDMWTEVCGMLELDP